jgi:hypothetical protein
MKETPKSQEISKWLSLYLLYPMVIV